MGTALLKDLGLQLREDTEGFSSQNGVAWILSTRETQSGSAAITPWQVPLRLGGQSSTWGHREAGSQGKGKRVGRVARWSLVGRDQPLGGAIPAPSAPARREHGSKAARSRRRVNGADTPSPPGWGRGRPGKPGVREVSEASSGRRGSRRAGRGRREGTSCQGLGLPGVAKEVLPGPERGRQEVGRRFVKGAARRPKAGCVKGARR